MRSYVVNSDHTNEISVTKTRFCKLYLLKTNTPESLLTKLLNEEVNKITFPRSEILEATNITGNSSLR